VDTDDEWIELLNASGSSLSLEDYRVIIYNGPSAFGDAHTESTLAGALVFGGGTGIVDVHAGDRVVLGNPIGTISSNVFLSLRDAGGTLVDFVEIGGVSTSTDRGGDGVNNGAPTPGEDGQVDLALAFESEPGVFHYPDEVVARYPDGVDTGNDIDDFAHREATPGASNGP
jgi:hypothetical protein